MDMKKKEYADYVKRRAPRSPIFKDCLWAFFVGGGICCAAEGLGELYRSVLAL